MFGKKELKKEIIRLKEENKKLADSYGKSKSHELEEQITDLEEKNTALNKNIKDLYSEIENLKSQKREVEKEKEQILFNYRKMEQDNSYQNSVIRNYENNIKLNESKLEETEHILAERNSIIDELESQIKVKDIEISAYKNAISNISFTFNNDGKINPKDFDISSITSYENENKKGKENVKLEN